MPHTPECVVDATPWPSGLTKQTPASHHQRCEQEQVQSIGCIQSHGLLFALSEPDLIVRQVSRNIAAILGITVESILGSSFELVLGAQQLETFRSQVATEPPFAATLFHLPVGSCMLDMHCVAHRQDSVLIVELEPCSARLSAEPIDIETQIRIPLSGMQQASGILELSRLAAGEIRRLTGFERVMVYRFDDEWNGEVVAEVMSPSPISYLGLRFPAGDIPPQVRRLFLLNPLRTIVDVASTPVPIVPEIAPLTGRALDLTHSGLRSASPIHLEYLRNMHVRSSMTVSIVVGHALWGMIACHDSEPRRVDHQARSICALIVQSFASQVVLRTDNAALQSRLSSRKLLETYMGSIEASNSIVDAEHLQSPQLLALFDADGLVCRIEGEVTSQGVTVPEDLLEPVLAKLSDRSARGIACSHMLCELHPAAASYASQASGALYLGLTAGSGDYLVLLRRELVETVIWAGNPKETVSSDVHDRLHPRTSFAAWHETVRGRSRPWSEFELENASFLREQLLRVRDAHKLSLANEALSIAREAQAVHSGRAEMAVSVLHDIGNAITGIGTRSAQLLAEPTWNEPENLARMGALFQSQTTLLQTVMGERKTAALIGLAAALESSLRQREIDLREHVRSLVSSVSHVQEILSVQRQFARQGNTGPRSRVALADLVHAAVALHAAGLEKRSVQLVQRVPANLPRLPLDRTRMVQVLGNLIRNACESFDGLQAVNAERRLEITAENTSAGWVTLTVKDSGAGFLPELGETFFERGASTKPQGSGIGLASCRSTVESHRGRIRMESEGPGKGATVTIDLPCDGNENENA